MINAALLQLKETWKNDSFMTYLLNEQMSKYKYVYLFGSSPYHDDEDGETQGIYFSNEEFNNSDFGGCIFDYEFHLVSLNNIGTNHFEQFECNNIPNPFVVHSINIDDIENINPNCKKEMLDSKQCEILSELASIILNVSLFNFTFEMLIKLYKLQHLNYSGYQENILLINNKNKVVALINISDNNILNFIFSNDVSYQEFKDHAFKSMTNSEVKVISNLISEFNLYSLVDRKVL